MTTGTARRPRRLVHGMLSVTVALGLFVPAGPAAASVPTMSYHGRVSAQDWNTDITNGDETYLAPWPTTTASWNASESSESQGPTGAGGVGFYHVRSIATQDVTPTFDDGNLASLSLEGTARVDVSASGCAEGDRECVASGHARSEFEVVIQVVETADLRLSGTLVANVGNPSPDMGLCELGLYSISATTVDYEVPCGEDNESGAWTVAFEETVPAGLYALDVTALTTSNAYSFREVGFAQVDVDLRLDVGGTTDPEEVDFDWTVEDRFGFDEDSQVGLVDYYEPDGSLEAAPASYPVDFEALDSTPCDTTRSRTWLIDGIEAREPQADLRPCEMTYEFPAEGVYDVTLEVRDAAEAVIGTQTEEVVVQDWLIVSIGDSVASGEGNPDIASIGNEPETWQDQQCHRTAIAGPAQAAALIERADPKTSVTFIHLACSGATIASGLIGPYVGVEDGIALPPQLDDVLTYTAGREIDAITVSIGANDVHFSDIVKKCLLQVACHRDEPSKAARYFAQKVVHLPAWYADLQAGFASRELDASRVFITQYFDPTRDDLGAVCPDGTLLGEAPFVGGGPVSLEISRQEADWASNGMLVRLDAEVRAGAAAHGWHFVGGIREPFLTHGYCAAGNWIVRISDSFLYQGDKNGSLHPNAPGHELYGIRIAEDLRAQLYDDGDLANPRPPAD